jgi:4'-phosphopantetheinyl transferase
LGANSHGKPTLADAGDIAFNISHSGDYVLVAVGFAQAIGVDVEQWRPDLDIPGVGAQVFTPAELELICAAPDVDRIARFFRQWTFKEAVAKASGLGLSLDVTRFEIRYEDGAPYLPAHRAPELGPGADWRLQPVPAAPGYSAALAVLPWRPAAARTSKFQGGPRT